MKAKQETYLGLAAICGVLVCLSATGIALYSRSPLLRGSLDGILLLSICTTVGILFGFQLAAVARSAGWLTKDRTARDHLQNDELTLKFDTRPTSR